jgi:hypothetical protein
MGRHWVGLLAFPIALGVASCELEEREPPSPGSPGGPGGPQAQGSGPETPAGKSQPALSGGTLLVLSDPDLVVVSEPTLNRVFVVHLSSSIADPIELEPGADPGRAIEDADGNVHVVLRGQNAILTLDPAGGVTRTTPVCSAPRGIGYDAASDSLYVACVQGALWNISADDGKTIKTFQLEPDLRDVVVSGGHIFVSKLRTAEVLVVSDDGEITGRRRPQLTGDFTSTVAWRMAAFGDGVIVAHQGSANREIDVAPTSEEDVTYQGDGSCEDALVQAAVTTLRVDANGALTSATTPLSTLHLPIDVATAGYASEIAVPSPGMDLLVRVDPSIPSTTGCNLGDAIIEAAPGARPVAIGYSGERLVIQSRTPPEIAVLDAAGQTTIPLGEPVDDIGYELFHFGRTASSISCASCHPEGRDDGHVWSFSDVGTRRTQQLLGGIASTAPFHWSGDLEDFHALMTEVFDHRMGQGAATAADVKAVVEWLDGLPQLPQEPGREAGSPGRLAFEKAKCQDCHAGDKLQSGGSHDVGTGGKFQVPSLRGVGVRAPFMHNGCASTLEDRFDDEACGGGSKHGSVDELTDVERAQLIDYLRGI